MKRIFKLAVCMLAFGHLAASCQKPGAPVGDDPLDETIVLDGESMPAAKTFLEIYSSEYYMFTATPDPTAQSFNDIYERGLDYVQALLLPSQLGGDCDITEDGIAVYGKIGDLVFGTGPQDEETVQVASGTVRLDYDKAGLKGGLKLDCLLDDGSEIEVNASAVMSESKPVNENFMTIDGTVEPVRAAFYLADKGSTVLYFTSAAVYSAQEMMSSARDYFYIMVPDTDLTGGGTIDLSAASEGTAMAFVSNSLYGESTSAGDAVSAAYSLLKTGEGEYAAKISATFADGTTVTVDFEGTCVSADYSPVEPEKQNEFTYGGVSESILSALVDCSDPDIWHIWLSSTGGLEYLSEFQDPYSDSIHITAPAVAFDGDSYGFSTYKGILKFEYGGQTWMYEENGSVRGTLIVTLEGDLLTVDFNNYDGFSGHYSGIAVVVK